MEVLLLMQSRKSYSKVRVMLSDTNRARKRLVRNISFTIAKHLKGFQYDVLSVSEYAKRNDITCIDLSLETNEVLPGPKFADRVKYPVNADKGFTLKHPAIRAYTFHDCMVVGGISFVFMGKTAVVPDGFDLSRYVAELEISGMAKYLSEGTKFELWGVPARRRLEGRGICLAAEHSANYAHFVTEVLPRFALVDALPEFKDFPLILDASVPKKFVAMINRIARHPRDILYVRKGGKLRLGLCVSIEPTAFTPTQDRLAWPVGQSSDPLPGLHTFSKPAIEYARGRVLSSVSQPESRAGASERVLLIRDRSKSFNKRNVLNWEEIRSKLEEKGFDAYNPAEDIFENQVHRFAGAELIVSEVGAALVNAMFRVKPCTIWCLAPYFEHADYYYFSNLAQLLGHELVYFIGPRSGAEPSPLKEVGDYWVNPEYFDKALESL